MVLQNAEMRSKGVGWKAAACPDPGSCEDGLCAQDWGGKRGHPADPLAFAKWRVRARLADIPSHVLVTTAGRATTAWRQTLFGRVAVIAAVALATTAGILAARIGRHGMPVRLNGSEAV